MKKALITIAIALCALAPCATAEEGFHKNGGDYYQVSVLTDGEWVEAHVYNALVSDSEKHHGEIWNDWDNSKALRDTMCFALFNNTFSKSVKVRVRKMNGGFTTAEVRPSAYRIKVKKLSDEEIEFTLPSYQKRKVSVEFDGDRMHNLFLLPYNASEDVKPQKNNSLVHYYGPGEHNVGNVILKDNETLFIDEGAILYSSVTVAGNNCTIEGHGILSGASLKHWGDQWSNGEILICANYSGTGVVNGLTIKDVTILDSPSWTLAAFNYNGVLIDNINIISWSLNGDGIDLVSTSNAEIKDCFIRTYDDCITLKVRYNSKPILDLGNVSVHDCLIWNDYARGIVLGPEMGNKDYGTGTFHDVKVEDCTFLYQTKGIELDDVRAALAIYQYAAPEPSGYRGRATEMRDISLSGLVFDNIGPGGRHIYIKQDNRPDEKCSLSNVTFKNIQIKDKFKNGLPYCLIQTNGNLVDTLAFDNFKINGKRVKSLTDKSFSTDGTVSNLSFK